MSYSNVGHTLINPGLTSDTNTITYPTSTNPHLVDPHNNSLSAVTIAPNKKKANDFNVAIVAFDPWLMQITGNTGEIISQGASQILVPLDWCNQSKNLQTSQALLGMKHGDDGFFFNITIRIRIMIFTYRLIWKRAPSIPTDCHQFISFPYPNYPKLGSIPKFQTAKD